MENLPSAVVSAPRFRRVAADGSAQAYMRVQQRFAGERVGDSALDGGGLLVGRRRGILGQSDRSGRGQHHHPPDPFAHLYALFVTL